MKLPVRKLIVSCLVLAAICAAFGVPLWQCTAQNQISLQNYEKIRVGMRRQEIDRLLGLPRWEVKPIKRHWIDPESMGNMMCFPDEWWGREGVIQIWYKDGNVAQKNLTAHRCEVEPLTPWDRIGDWLQKLP
jgi:hypothetical protein